MRKPTPKFLYPKAKKLTTAVHQIIFNQLLTLAVQERMEEDRRLADLGIAADIEEAQLAQASQAAEATQNGDAPLKQPKKRFVGRRAAAEAAAKNGVVPSNGGSGAVAGMKSMRT